MYQVIGKQCVDYQNKDGKQIKGLKLWLAYEKKGVTGVAADPIYLSQSKLDECGINPDEIKIDDLVTVFYNRYGKVESIAVQ